VWLRWKHSCRLGPPSQDADWLLQPWLASLPTHSSQPRLLRPWDDPGPGPSVLACLNRLRIEGCEMCEWPLVDLWWELVVLPLDLVLTEELQAIAGGGRWPRLPVGPLFCLVASPMLWSVPRMVVAPGLTRCYSRRWQRVLCLGPIIMERQQQHQPWKHSFVSPVLLFRESLPRRRASASPVCRRAVLQSWSKFTLYEHSHKESVFVCKGRRPSSTTWPLVLTLSLAQSLLPCRVARRPVHLRPLPSPPQPPSNTPVWPRSLSLSLSLSLLLP
jgi:hypothetical protein